MPKEHHVIYVPGLADDRKGYELLVGWWTVYGVIPHVHRVGWYDEERTFKPKLQRLLSIVDDLLDKGNIVSLVGGSAGGSAVLNVLFEQPKINAVVNICGRLRAGQNVSPSLEVASKKSAAFKDSVLVFESNEPDMKLSERRKVLNLIPVWDAVVPKTTVPLEGATNEIIPSVGHMLSGFLGLTLFSPLVMNFIHKKALEGNDVDYK